MRIACNYRRLKHLSVDLIDLTQLSVRRVFYLYRSSFSGNHDIILILRYLSDSGFCSVFYSSDR